MTGSTTSRTPGCWKNQSELPNVAYFETFRKVVSEEEVAKKIPCGPDVDRMVPSVKQDVDAGSTEVALVQIGPDRTGFCHLFQRELGAKLRLL